MSDDLAERLVNRMTNTERDQSFPDSVPRDAATIILIDRSDKQAKVLLGRRHHSHKFMPGKFVFPGGRVEAHDRVMTAVSELHAETYAKLMAKVENAASDLPRGLALASVREMAEETGILLGAKRPDAPEAPGEIWNEFAKASVHPDLSQLHFIARAITPPKRPKRFDTRFFTADATAIAHRIEGVVGPDSELVELVWAPVEEAAQFDMPAITSVVLEELAARVAAGMAHSLPVPFYTMGSDKFSRELL